MIWTPKKPHLILPGDEDYQPPGNCFLMPHRAMMGAAGGGIEANFYQDIVTAGLTSGLKLCLDAGSATSYPGSGQDWIDLSGNLGSDEFHRGTDDTSGSDDPAFNGSSGGLSISEYWSFDGSADFLKYGGSTETWMDDWHQVNAEFTFLIWWDYDDGSADQWLWANADAASENGVALRVNDAGPLQFACYKNGGTSVSLTADAGPTDNSWNLTGFSMHDQGSSDSFFYNNGAYVQDGGSDLWSLSYSSPDSGVAASQPRIGCNKSEASYFIVSTGKIAGIMAWNGTHLTKENCDTLYNAQKARFGL